MESISQALQALSKNPKLQDFTEKQQALFNHPLIRRLRMKYPQLDEDVLKLHLNRLHQYVSDHQSCEQCPGLERCPNDMQGHYTKLTVQQWQDQVIIHDAKVACKKYTSHQSSDALKKRVRSFYLDEPALEKGFSIAEMIRLDKERSPAVDKVVEYLQQTKHRGLGTKGLYLAGGFGTGKTYLMCFLLHELAKQGHSGVIIYMPDFLEELKSMFQEPMKLKETVELMKETDVLVFDDIGAENINAWARDHILGTILNYRMNRKPTFYTSNYDLDALQKHFSFTHRDGEEEFKGQRLMDRIRPFVDVVTVKGANKRGE